MKPLITTTQLAAAAVVAALALTGCVPAPGTQASDGALPTSSSSPTPQRQQDGSELPSDGGTVIPVPEAGTNTQAAAVTAAEKVVATFGQPTLDAAGWLQQMTPLLSPTGYEAYTGTDPAQIPVTRVTGTGRVLQASTDVSLIVEVPTDAGPYNVTLTRTDVSALWLAERIRPAQG